MTGSRRQDWTPTARLIAAALALVAAAPAAAQDGQFDLRTRATPSAAPSAPVVGPSDPDNPTVRPRPRPADAAPLELPSAAPTPTPSPAANAAPSTERPTLAPRGPVTRATLSPPQASSSPAATSAQPPSAAQSAASPAPAPGRYEPRRLDVVAPSGLPGWWLALGALAVVLALGGWLAWSRHFRHRARALPVAEIERPVLPERNPAPATRPTPAGTPALALALQATRMSATLINTTLSYRLAVTNRSAEPLSDVRITGDMIAAHASRRADELLGGAGLPELHRIATLAPGERVTLGGDIRLPLVSITPIRRGNATFFVPLARFRARGVRPDGRPVEGGGTFLVGQEPGASKRLQPFRLDLGPRNYSRLSQQLLPAA